MNKIFLAILIISTTLFTGCSSGGGDPKAVLSEFFDAMAKKDMATVRKLATEDSKSMLDLMEMGMKTASAETEMYDKSKMEFGETKIEGNKATIPVKETTSGETMNYSLKKEGGKWKVAFDKASIMSMGMDKMDEKGIDMNEMMNEMNKIDMDSLKNTIKGGTEALDSAAKLLEQLKK